MADEKPVEPVVVAPVVAAAPVAPVVEAAPVAPAEVAAVAPVVEAPVAPEKVPSLLEKLEVPGEVKLAEKVAETKPEEKPAEAEKPVEAEKAVETKPEEVVPPEPVKPESVQYKWDAPESLKFTDEIKGEVGGALDAFRADPTNPRPLFDQAEKMMQRYADEVRADQFKVFEQTKRNWETAAMADEQIGGSAWNTSKGTIARMRDLFVSAAPRGTPEWQADNKAFIEMLDVTGAGSHPAMLKYLHNVGQRFDEPAPLPLANVKTVPEQAPKGNPLHDNPRSQRNGA